MVDRITIIKSVPKQVYTILDELGVPSHLKGYDLFAYTIKVVSDNPEYLDHITKVLYPEIAKAFGSSTSKVERAMRHALSRLEKMGNQELIRQYFGYSANGHLTNSQFIATIFRVYIQSKDKKLSATKVTRI